MSPHGVPGGFQTNKQTKQNKRKEGRKERFVGWYDSTAIDSFIQNNNCILWYFN